MSRIIDADRYRKDLLSAYDDVSMELDVLDRQLPIDAIIIPKGASNRDMLKTMFNVDIVDDFTFSCGIKLADSNYILLNKDWLNAPYKGVQNLSGKPKDSECNKNLCNSCITKGCMAGMFRKHCDFYKAESELGGGEEIYDRGKNR